MVTLLAKAKRLAREYRELTGQPLGITHSGAGAVPLLLPHKAGRSKYSLVGDFAFDEDEAFSAIDRLVVLLWSNGREPAENYIQEAELPLILTMAANGSYAEAMRSVEAMEELIDHLSAEIDRNANMDF
jgi:hypothetical protein